MENDKVPVISNETAERKRKETEKMYCPLCARALTPVERQGVEIDFCAECGGMWLDNGELTELIRREALAAVAAGQTVLTAKRRDREYDRTAEGREVNHFALSRGNEPTRR